MTGKRIIGIILSALGGIATIIFGLSAATVHQRLFFTRAAEESAAATAYGLTAVGVVVLIVGIVLIAVGGKNE
jgi:hypothetical protein